MDEESEASTFPVEDSTSDIPVDYLLSLSRTAKEAVEISRAEVTYDDMPEYRDKLLNKKNSYTHFAHIYFERYTKLSKIIRNKWKDCEAKHVNKILNVKPNELCYLVGTVYMEMQNKPNILAELSRNNWEPAPILKEKYCSPTDEFWLDDDSGRIKIVGDRLKEEIIVSGIIMSVLGKENSQGEFEVSDIYRDDDKYVALISGLNIDTSGISETRLQIMMEYFTGELGCFHEQKNISSKIARIIIAGNSLATAKPKKYGYDNSLYDAEPLNNLDNFLEKLCSLLPVHIMPGQNDPADSTLPQQPILSNLLPKVGTNPNFHSVTNPYWCKFDDVTFLGTSGQTIDDIYKYIEIEDRLIIAERTLHWRHMAPTAPDTLWCYPFKDVDPFIIDQMPHVYFIGNQKEFATKLVKGIDQQCTRIILLPSFAESGIVVFLNLNNLKCHTIYFPSTFF
ncbi:1557_t:CDS:10 [Rhizophagus irregularis]|nr:1557_t:CDS:10 [Rhizophagus irregularis]